MNSAAVADIPADEDNEINLTPMLDVVFIMLIFFIVTASFIKEMGIPVGRPNGQVDTVDQSASIFVVIGEHSGIWIEDRLIDPRAVRANIERMGSMNPGAPVLIQAHDDSFTDTLVSVMNSSREAGIYNVLIAE